MFTHDEIKKIESMSNKFIEKYEQEIEDIVNNGERTEENKKRIFELEAKIANHEVILRKYCK